MKIKESEINKVLVMNLESISEVILSTPVTRALKEAYPSCELTMMTVPYTAKIAEMNPFVDRVIAYDQRGDHRGISGLIESIAAIRKEKFDLCVCLNHSVHSAIQAWAAGIKYRAGYDEDWAKLFLTHAADPSRTRIQHQTINHLQVLKPLGVTTGDTSVCLAVDERAEKIIETTLHLGADRPGVAFCPMNAEHPSRNLSREKCLEIARRLETAADVYFIGGAAERTYLLSLAEDAGLGKERVFGGSLNLKEAAVFLKRVRVLLSVETGAIHIAQAIGTPVVAIFGPTDPIVYGPCGNRDVVISHKTACMPCFGKSDCAENRCIEEIAVDEIVKKVLERMDADAEKDAE